MYNYKLLKLLENSSTKDFKEIIENGKRHMKIDEMGICRTCKNKTCKRNKYTNRKQCNIFVERLDENDIQ